MNNLKELFGENLQFIRKAKGLTQEQLGELIDINQRQLTRIECGINFPSSDTLEKICCCLNVPIKQLFDFELKEQEVVKTGTDSRCTYKAIKFGDIVKLKLLDKDEKTNKIVQSNNKEIKCTDSDKEMLRIAKKSAKPITVEYLDDGNTYRITIYFPDGSFKHIKNIVNTDVQINKITESLKGFSNDNEKLELFQKAIWALSNRFTYERTKKFLEEL